MFLSWREMKRLKVRYALIGLIMVLISLLVLFISGLAKGLSADNASSIIKMDADTIVMEKGSDHRINRSYLQNETVEDIRKSIGENQTAPLGVQMATLIQNKTEKKQDATFFAIDAESFLAPTITEGSMFSNEATNGVVADESLREEGFSIGDTFKDQASGMEFTIIGFSKGESYSHTPVIHVNLKEWSSISQQKAETITGYTPVNAVVTKGEESTMQRLETNVSGIEVVTKEEALKAVPGYEAEQGSLMLMIVFLFFISAFVLGVFFYVMTIQNMNQFGVLKAIGASTSFLIKNMLTQVLLLTIVSLSVSIGLAYGASLLLPAGMPYELSVGLVVTCSILFLVIAVLGSLISLYRITKIDALEAIGRVA